MQTATTTELPLYGLIPEYTLPTRLNEVWEDINQTNFFPEKCASTVVVFAGLLDYDIYNTSWLRWQRHLQGYKRVIIAGIHDHSGLWPNGRDDMRRLRDEHPDFATWQIEADHTPGQTVWLADQLKGETAVATYVHQFHLCRATMTLLRHLAEANWVGKVFPMGWKPGPGQLPLAGMSNMATHDELTPGEMKRYHDYTEKGDVAPPGLWFGRYRP
jgi:hypothetical protein